MLAADETVTSLAVTGGGQGYWLFTNRGRVLPFGDAEFFAFGDAAFRGSMAGLPLDAPVTGMAAYGNGYLLVAEDGGAFSFSDRRFEGGLGDRPPDRPVASVASADSYQGQLFR